MVGIKISSNVRQVEHADIQIHVSAVGKTLMSWEPEAEKFLDALQEFISSIVSRSQPHNHNGIEVHLGGKCLRSLHQTSVANECFHMQGLNETTRIPNMLRISPK